MYGYSSLYGTAIIGEVGHQRTKKQTQTPEAYIKDGGVFWKKRDFVSELSSLTVQISVIPSLLLIDPLT